MIGNREHSEPQSGAADDRTKAKDPLKHATFYLLLATTLFTGWYALTARETLRVIEDQERRQLRAYIGLIEMVVSQFSVGQPILFSGKIKNFGVTPALNVRYKNKAEITYRSADTVYRILDYRDQAASDRITVYKGNR